MIRHLLLLVVSLLVACSDPAPGVDRSDGGRPEDAATPDSATDSPADWAVAPPPEATPEVECPAIQEPATSPVDPSEIVCTQGRSEHCTPRVGGDGVHVCDGYGQWGPCLSTTLQIVRDNETGMWRHGAPMVLPPRLIAPLSARRVTSRRPTLRWSLPEGITRARVELCDDRACARRILQTEVSGSAWRPGEVLRPGVVFWRVLGVRSDGEVAWTSATWEFNVGYRDTPVDTISRTLKDFNGDGFDDAVVDVGVLLGSRQGARAQPLRMPGDNIWYTVGDVNGDGFADLLTSAFGYHEVGWLSRGPDSTGDGRVRVFLGNPGCPFQRERHVFQVASTPFVGFGSAMAVGDFNGDGFDDLVVAFQGGIAVFAGGPDGLTREPMDVILVDPGEGHFFLDDQVMRFAGDIDRDGYADLALLAMPVPTGPSLLQVYFGNPEGRLGARVQSVAGTQNGEFAASLAGADFTGDGFSDLIVGAYNSFHLFVGSAEGIRHERFQLTPLEWHGQLPRPETAAVPGDINGDGLIDPIISREFIYRSLGIGGIPAAPALITGYYFVSIPGDMDADGYDDLLGNSVDPRNDPTVFVRGGSFEPGLPARAWAGVSLFVPLND